MKTIRAYRVKGDYGYFVQRDLFYGYFVQRGSKIWILCSRGKNNIYSYFVQRDQHGKIAKHLTQRKVLFWSNVFIAAAVAGFLNSLIGGLRSYDGNIQYLVSI